MLNAPTLVSGLKVTYNYYFCFVDYAVKVKTGVGCPGCGTDAVFNLTFVSSENDRVTFVLDGAGDKMEIGR